MFALSTGSFSCQYGVDLAVEMDSEKERNQAIQGPQRASISSEWPMKLLEENYFYGYIH